MKALVVSNGVINDSNWLKEIRKKFDFVLCADGGCNHCIKASIIPDLVIGDLDSISPRTLDRILENKIPIEKFPVKKNATDTELAMDFLISKGIKDITFVGVTGSRMDHTLANIFLLKRLYQKGCRGKIVDEKNTIYLVDKELAILKKEGYYISIIPLMNPGINISLDGFEYELDQANISFGSTLGISNKITEEKGYIKVHKGICLVCISKD